MSKITFHSTTETETIGFLQYLEQYRIEDLLYKSVNSTTEQTDKQKNFEDLQKQIERVETKLNSNTETYICLKDLNISMGQYRDNMIKDKELSERIKKCIQALKDIISKFPKDYDVEAR